jgi:PAS domain S-box-containing protein
MALLPLPQLFKFSDARDLLEYLFDLFAIAAAYFALEKLDLALASIHLGAIPIAPALGFALGAILVRGLRVWPAIFTAAFAAHIPTAVSDTSPADAILSAAIATGDTLAAVIGAYLINLWSGGRGTFETPARVAKFVAVGLGPGAMLAATLNVGAVCLIASSCSNLPSDWVAHWLRAASGILVIAPAVVLWTIEDCPAFDYDKTSFGKNWGVPAGAFVAAAVFGFIGFSPLLELPASRTALSLLAVFPLLLAALRCGQRITAVCTLILSIFAVWGAWPGIGPFGSTPNESFLVSSLIMISASVLGLVLSADVVQRQRVKTRLSHQEANLRALLSHADLGIAQIDANGQFKLVNTRYCDLVHQPAMQLLRLRLQDILQIRDGSQIVELLGGALRTGDSFVLENNIALEDGARLWIRTRLAPIFYQNDAPGYLVATAEDVTAQHEVEDSLRRERQNLVDTVEKQRIAIEKGLEDLDADIKQRMRVEDALRGEVGERRRTQDALKETEWRLRTVIQGVTDYAIFLLDCDGCITDWNVGAQRIHQYAAAEIVGGHFSRFYSEEEQQSGEPARALQVAAYEGKHSFEGWRVRRDKSKFWASVVIEAVRDEGGTLVGFVNITHDVTERRQAQVSLERAQEQLGQSQKMDALGQLTGSIAHDFNNLLMIVSGHAQLLRRRLSDPKHLQALDAMNSAANRGESLTRQLLAFSRRQPINPIVTDLKERVDAVREMLVGSLRGNIQLKCDIPSDVWPVEVDIAELELALVNIAVNARDAMPAGGAITLTARNVNLQKSDGVDQLEGDFVALAMTDSGVGITPEVLPRIFEPFFTTKALGKGTGLGLSQVYGFSHQSGGAVVAASTVGKGTAITIYLPRRHASPVKAPAPAAAEPIAPNEGTILMVEDNPEVAQVTASLLEQLGYHVMRAQNAMDALSVLQRGHQITLVFSDIVMPGNMNGVALAQEIGNRYPQLPVLLTSGYSDVAQTAASQFRILRKPFQLHALEKAIREALEHARARDTDDRVLPFSPRRQGSEGKLSAS